MGKRVLIIEGSPRKDGNSAALARAFAEGASEAGAVVETVRAVSLKYAVPGCTGCYGCKRSEKFECVIEDEATPILARLPDNDIVVLATPVYWFAASAQLKMLFDRAYSLFKWDPSTGRVVSPLEGKALILLAAGGGPLDWGLELLDKSYRAAAGLLGLSFESLLVPDTGRKPVAADPELSRKARDLGRRLADQVVRARDERHR